MTDDVLRPAGYTYKCALCQEEFVAGVDDADTLEEYRTLFPNGPSLGYMTDVVCDDCFECCRPDIARAALQKWRMELHELPIGSPVMVKCSLPPILRRGTIEGNSETPLRIKIGDDIFRFYEYQLFPLKGSPDDR